MMRNRANTVLLAVMVILLAALAGAVYMVLRPQLLQKQAQAPQCNLEIASCEWDAAPEVTGYTYIIIKGGVVEAPVKIGTIDANAPRKITFAPEAGVVYKCAIEPVNACGTGLRSTTIGTPGGPGPNASGVCPTPPPVTPTPAPTTAPTVAPTATSSAKPTNTPAPTAAPTQTAGPTNTPAPTAQPAQTAAPIVTTVTTPSPTPAATNLPHAASVTPTVLMGIGAGFIVMIGALLFFVL